MDQGRSLWIRDDPCGSGTIPVDL